MGERPREGLDTKIGERIVLVKIGQTATVLQLAPTEWGLRCDLDLDSDPAAAYSGGRRVHASTELRPLDA